MKKMETRKKVLLGVNPNTNEIFFGEFEITTRNNYKEFTASFDVGSAFDIDSIDLYEQCNYDWECLDAQAKIDLLDDGEKTKQDVFEDWTAYTNYKDFIDCSCTDIETTLRSGQTVNFETTCGGQHDIREDEENYKNIIFTNKQAVEKLLVLWDKYHLENIEENIEEVEKEINFIIEKIGFYTLHAKETKNFIYRTIEEV